MFAGACLAASCVRGQPATVPEASADPPEAATAHDTRQPVIGLMDNDAAVWGRAADDGRDPAPPWKLVAALSEHYDIHRISSGHAIPSDVDVLVVPELSGLDQPSLDHVAAYLDEGRPALLIVDPLLAFDPGLSASYSERPSFVPAIPGSDPPPKGDAAELLRRVGVQWDDSRVVHDLGTERPASAPAYALPLTADGQDESDVLLVYSGSLAPTESTVDFVPLLSTSEHAGHVDFGELVSAHPLFGPQLAPLDTPEPGDETAVVAARVRGSSKVGEVVVVADLDAFGDQLLDGADFDEDGSPDLGVGNRELLLTAVESLIPDPPAVPPAKEAGSPLLPRLEPATRVGRMEVIESSAEGSSHLAMIIVDGSWRLQSPLQRAVDDSRIVTAVEDAGRSKIERRVSEDARRHTELGVVDPEASTGSYEGRGRRVSIWDDTGSLLGDVIVGRPVPESKGQRYVRTPGDPAVYAATWTRIPSTDLEAWTRVRILDLAPEDVVTLTYNRYRLDPQAQKIVDVDPVTVESSDPGRWTSSDATTANVEVIGQILEALAGLEAVGSVPRTTGMRALTETLGSLQKRGFFVTSDATLYGAAGSITLQTREGLVFTLVLGSLAKDESRRNVLVAVDRAPGRDGSDVKKRSEHLSRRLGAWVFEVPERIVAELPAASSDILR